MEFSTWKDISHPVDWK